MNWILEVFYLGCIIGFVQTSDNGEFQTPDKELKDKIDLQDVIPADILTEGINVDDLEDFLSLNTIVPRNISSTKLFMKPQRFFQRYVLHNRPIVLLNNIGNSTAIKSWSNDNYFLSIPQPMTSWVNTYKVFAKPKHKSRRQTFYKFLKIYNKKEIVLRDEVPYFMRENFLLPSCLRCNKIEKCLSRHMLWISSDVNTSGFERNGMHSLKCVVSGELTITLANHTGYRNQDEETNVKRDKGDKEKIFEYWMAKLSPGDCLFIPSKWIFQTITNSRVVAVDIFWKNQTMKLDSDDCKDYRDQKSVHDVTFVDEVSTDNNRKHGILHYFILYLFKHTNLTRAQFVHTAKNDEILMADMVEWTEEYDAITNELFNSLNTDDNLLFSFDDVINLTPAALEEVDGMLEDRMIDFEDLMNDQKAELKQEEKTQQEGNKPDAHSKEAEKRSLTEKLNSVDEEKYVVVNADDVEEIIADDEETLQQSQPNENVAKEEL